MKIQRCVTLVVLAVFAFDCLASPFTFPESGAENKETQELDSATQSRRNQGHHHFPHKNKVKKKRKKRPCYYKTGDGRTFFWTGLNIYETNIYVNQGFPPSDINNLGVGPCSSSNSPSDETSQGSQDILQGNPITPQRPNRPILQSLASYIPSGPAAWNWAQGVPWYNYLPNQQSFSSAVGNFVDYLPGFGSYRPRPPSIPVRPVTESPFTRPTEFTRPPTFTRPTQQPVYTRPTQQPIYTRPTQQPVYTRPTQQPIYTRPTQQPIYTRPTQQPVYTRPTQQPIYTRPTQQPVYTRPTQQPVYTRPTQQPIFTRPTSTSAPSPNGEDGSDENYDYSNFSSENSDNSADTTFTGLASAGNPQSTNQPASNIPSVGSIGNGIKPVYEGPGKRFNEYILKPIRGSIREVVSWF